MLLQFPGHIAPGQEGRNTKDRLVHYCHHQQLSTYVRRASPKHSSTKSFQFLEPVHTRHTTINSHVCSLKLIVSYGL